jgi:tight adherence protein B
MDKIELSLLFVIAFSLATLTVLAISYYKRIQRLQNIKQIFQQDQEELQRQLLKQEEEKKKNKSSFTEKIKRQLNLAGIHSFQLAIYFSTYFFIVMTFSVAFIIFLKSLGGFLFGIFFGTIVHLAIINFLIQRRLDEFNRALALAISVLVKMMRNGVGFEQALQKSIDVSSSRLFRSIFENFFKEKNTLGEQTAFNNILHYVDSKELRIFAIAVKIGRESGGKFSQTLEKLETTIRYRKKMQDKIGVITREGSLGSYIVAVIAFFLYFAIDFNFQGKLNQYYMESEWGRFQLLGIILWIILGLFINKLITKVRV